MEPKRRHYFAQIPTIALLVLFALSPWLGLFLFIAKAIDRDALKKERAQEDYTADFRAQSARTPADTADEDYIYGHDTPTAEQKKAKKRQKDLTALCTALGALFLAVGVLGIGDAAALAAAGGGPGSLISALGQILGGGGALALGVHWRRTRRQERQLDKIVGERDNIALRELFAAAGIDAARGRSVLESAIDHGYFGADAYIDNRTDMLVVRGPAPEPPAPQPAPAPAAPASPEDPYTALLRRLRQANDAIADPAMSAKVTRLEQLSARIFALAQKDPAKRPQLKKFMDYYLPTALKLLDAYAQFSAQEAPSESVAEAKRSIERSTDLLITAFEAQLEKLNRSDALDVTADIAALEGMLSLDGLTSADFVPPPAAQPKQQPPA